MDTGLGSTQNEGMNIVGALVGINNLQIEHVTDHAILIRDAIAPLWSWSESSNSDRDPAYIMAAKVMSPEGLS